jgi:hypothetical protein
MKFLLAAIYNSYLIKLAFKLLSSLKADYTQLGFTHSFVIKSIIKINLTIDYYITYFLLYNPIGITLVFCSGFLIGTFQESDPHLLGYFCFVIYFGGLGVILPLYFLIQNKYVRDTLKEVVGESDFGLYMGHKPGSKTLVRATGAFGSALGLGLIVHIAHQGYQEKVNEERLEKYLQKCKAAGIPVNPHILDKYVLERSESVLNTLVIKPLQTLFGYKPEVETSTIDPIDIAAAEWRNNPKNSAQSEELVLLRDRHPAKDPFKK